MIQYATLAGGCFWCTQAVFKRLKGVLSVTVGYAGGENTNPYCSLVIDPKIQKLLDKFNLDLKKEYRG